MTTVFTRIRRAVSDLVAEDRPDFKRVDVSRVRYDDGAWLPVQDARRIYV
jgi:hypothetical protein